MAYLYRHIRLDKDVPFYIGIGTSPYHKRAFTMANKQRNPIWKRIAAKTKISIEIMLDNISLEEAKEREKYFISLYGRIESKNGTLANITAGGESGYDPPESTRKKMSEARIGEKNIFYGKKHSKETIDIFISQRRGITKGPLSQSTKDKIGKANKGKKTWCYGKKDPKGAASRTGIKHPRYDGKLILCFSDKGELLHEFACTSEAAKHFGSDDPNQVRRVLKGEYGRNTWKGMVFKYQ